ncbi:class IIb bacteriocin, lactobin A/cerein 7B family [Flavivirga jejuensis]|uniref:Class IIb bacteriocin, lactobin A/cerein 7B family n=1 Tax=Flavivirga jejuensis TaxID=870487 RepID=A0ABT8WVQ7_9FLAO|nr:class IIb bacteriocin, lactobin A/cerein 7B family [Flavivirga jejuensis]MDO5977174.1 class IIb bacteriocin, lactobin A/cerein 7B family [Flavivirga jejuensis]
MKNLENFGIQEMNTKEMKEVNGGFWGLFALAVVIAIAVFGKNVTVS